MAASKQTFKSSLTRGTRHALVLKVSSNKVIESYGWELRSKYRKTDKILTAVLVKANGKPVATKSYYHLACSPAQYTSNNLPEELPPGNGIICGFSTGLPPRLKSMVIDITTNKCLPDNAIPDVTGPKGACKS
jgi:hypothetical protein